MHTFDQPSAATVWWLVWRPPSWTLQSLLCSVSACDASFGSRHSLWRFDAIFVPRSTCCSVEHVSITHLTWILNLYYLYYTIYYRPLFFSLSLSITRNPYLSSTWRRGLDTDWKSCQCSRDHRNCAWVSFRPDEKSTRNWHCRTPNVSLTEMNVVNVPMSNYAKICFHVVLLFTRDIVENHYRLRFWILGSYYFFVLTVWIVVDTLHILGKLAQKIVLVLVQGLWPKVNISRFQAIWVYDERQESIALATILRAADNSAQSIGQQCSVTSFFIATLPCKFIEIRYG